MRRHVATPSITSQPRERPSPVPPPLPSDRDSKIRAAIWDRVRRSPFVRGEAVELDAEDGIVHLRGWVRSAQEQRHLVGIASLVLGVRAVHDHLRLRVV